MQSRLNFVDSMRLFASLPAHYERDIVWAQKSGARTTLQSPNRMTVNINDIGYILKTQAEYDLDAGATWDTVVGTDYTVAANRAGLDFYIYACQQSSLTPKILVSANSTVPDGYTADTSRKIGGFHCLCLAVGTIGGHTLTGYLAGDILPQSVWDLKHRAQSDNEGMVYSEEAGIWVDIYLTSGTGASTASANGGTISDTRTWLDFIDDYGAVSKRMMTDEEFQLIAAGSNEETNIAGSADPVTTGGHSNTAGRRMISNIGCEDCCGAMWQWLSTQSYRYDADVAPTWTTAGKTLTAYHAASPGGNAIYLKYDASGIPYLCCNMANDTVDKILTFGSAYTLQITHDASAAVGSYQIYFDEDATLPNRLLCALPGLKTEYLRTSNPVTFLPIVYNASPGTPGVAINFDDDTDERLEFISPTTSNATIDLAYITSPAWGYYDLPGSKGSLYRQGTYGDIKLLAGGSWYIGTSCGSRARSAYYYRWYTNSYIGGRGASKSRKA